MVIKYYKNSNITYASRNRYKNIAITPFAQEKQKSVLLGNGAVTSIKTSVDNICDYVIIDDTRWFVTSYVYLNGKQVTLNLQRDVIGEFGISSFFGKIERGYTDSILKYRKELNLNQILKKRIKLLPNGNQYGNYSVNTHNNEKWGILYLTKPTGIDPNTGEPYPERVNINIPAFEPDVVDFPLLNPGEYIYEASLKTSRKLYTGLSILINGADAGTLVLEYDVENPNLSKAYVLLFITSNNICGTVTWTSMKDGVDPIFPEPLTDFAKNMASQLGHNWRVDTSGLSSMNPSLDYNGITIKNEDKYFRYSTEQSKKRITGYNYMLDYQPDDFERLLRVALNSTFTEFTLDLSGYGSRTRAVSDPQYVTAIDPKANESGYYNEYDSVILTRRELTASESGAIVIDTTKELIDEPFFILACPLYDVNITGSENYTIEQERAFMVFNTIIQYLSGESGYLVDAQIYPYCPTLVNVMSAVSGVPFFNVNSSTYSHVCTAQLLPFSDIKTEYIERQYSLISPEQSGKFDFNFYDYIDRQEDQNGNVGSNTNGINYAKINFIIKTALKPFSIISSAIIQRDTSSSVLAGISYESDLRGSQPSSNGFECSIATNAFEEYKRNNSNYQQIFALQREELQKQHSVEAVNEKTSMIVNTISATAMGAIGGGSIAGGGGGLISSAISAAGATAGGAAAGALVGTAMNQQMELNAELREYELNLQQQRFDLEIGTIKNLPNSINRISSFNEIIIRDFCYMVEVYECSEYEKELVSVFLQKYGYGLGIFGLVEQYYKSGWFVRGTLISSSLNANLHVIADKELKGGFYLNESI